MGKSVGNYFPFISGSRLLVTSFPVMSLPMTSLLPLKYDLDGDSILHVLRKQGRDAELIYWNCTEKDYARHRKYQRPVTRFPKNHNPPPAPSEINAKNVMAHIIERSRTSLDPIKF